MENPQAAQYAVNGDRSLQNRFVAVLIAGLVLDLGFLALRLYARRRWDAGFARDDAFLVAAFGPLIAYVTASLFNIYHMRSNAPMHGISQQFIIGFLTCLIAYALNTMFVKLSILSFYCRVFSRNKGLINFSWCLAIITVMFNLALVLVAALQCIPLSAAWSDIPGRCINMNTPLLVIGITNIVMDFAILFIPIRAVFQLQMKASKKLQVCGVFLTGAIVCIFSIFRVTAVTNVKPQDRTYAETWSGLVSFCEMFVGIIAACLPTFGRFFSRSKVASTIINTVRSPSRARPQTSSSDDGSFRMADSKSSKYTSGSSSGGGDPKVLVQETTNLVRDDKSDQDSLP